MPNTNYTGCIVNPIIVENLDGTVSIFNPNVTSGQPKPVTLNQFCCLALKPTYTFDIDTQECLWTTKETCGIENTIKLVLNPSNNNGAIFDVSNFSGDTYSLEISFDYLFKTNCQILSDLVFNSTFGGDSFINSEIQSKINILTNQIEEQYVSCETINNQIIYYENILINTPNTETTLIAQLQETLNGYKTDYSSCQNILNTLNNELSLLKASFQTENLVCSKAIDYFESLDVSMVLDIISGGTLVSVYEDTSLHPAIGVGNLYSYIRNNTNTGFYVSGGDPSLPLSLNLTGITTNNDINCETILDGLVTSLYEQSGLSGITDGFSIFSKSIPSNCFSSSWLNYTTTITDKKIIDLISNKEIKLSLKVNHTCSDICILLDNIKLNKNVTSLKETKVIITDSPGFVIEKVHDNKKSWVKNDSLVNRNFELININNSTINRNTNYDVFDSRLIINSKEIDLDVNLASAIETDVWCFINNNPCLLTGVTSCDPCAECEYKSFQDDNCFEFMDGYPYNFMDGTYTGSSYVNECCGDNKIDFNSLMTQPLSGVTVVEDFESLLKSELIDVKNRQTISSYPTLRALYDRYMNSDSFCGVSSSSFDYRKMDEFSNLLGNYWVDIIEQVVPATTIWGSVKIYSNTIFDQQKFKYKSYTTFFCNNPFDNVLTPSPINSNEGMSKDVDVVITTLNKTDKNGGRIFESSPLTCDKLWVTQMNYGSEFLGTVSIAGQMSSCDIEGSAINECTLQVSVDVDGLTAYVNIIGAATPLEIEWSNGETTKSTTFVSDGVYSVTVTDNNCCSVTTEFTILN